MSLGFNPLIYKVKLGHLALQDFLEDENIKTHININRAFGDFHEKEGAIIGTKGKENKTKRRDSFEASFSLSIILSFLPLLGKIFLGQFTEVGPSDILNFKNLISSAHGKFKGC